MANNRWYCRDQVATGATTVATRQPQRQPILHKRRHANWNWTKRLVVIVVFSSEKWVTLFDYYCYYFLEKKVKLCPWRVASAWFVFSRRIDSFRTRIKGQTARPLSLDLVLQMALLLPTLKSVERESFRTLGRILDCRKERPLRRQQQQ